MRSLLVSACTASLAVWVSACNCNVAPPETDGGTGGGSDVGGGSAGLGGGSGVGGGAGGGSGIGGGGDDGGAMGGGMATGGGATGGGTATGGGATGGGATGGGATGGGTGMGGGAASCTADQPCYPFTSGTPGTGACRNGTASCINGTLGPCVGAVGPSAEACNNIDDDCNAMTDDGLGSATCGVGACQNTVNNCVNGVAQTCMAGQSQPEVCNNTLDDDCNGVVNDGCGCIHMSPAGVDTATGSGTAPVRHFAVAQNIAADAGITSICVASGLNCPSTYDYGNAADGGEALVMRNGISVIGGYRDNATAVWPQNTNCVTRITAQNTQGVLFDHPVTSPTALSTFDVVGGNFATSAAVTVRGSTGAVVSGCTVRGGSGQAVMTSIGVDVTNVNTLVATPTLTRSAISGAPVAQDGGVSIGVRSFGSAPNITGNCSSFDNAGRCNSNCGLGAGATLYVRGAGATPGGTPLTTETAIGVLLDSSPKAVIDSSSVCAANTVTATQAAGVRIQGPSAGVIVRTSDISSFVGAASGNLNSVGVWAAACGSAAPWIFNNALIVGTSSSVGSRSDGVRAVGDCHPVIDNNRTITGGVEAAGQDTNGVYCALDTATGIASKCTVLSNASILGSSSGFPPRSVGVRCDDGACARIDGNTLISGRGGNLAAGVLVSRSGPVIVRNVITAGCGRNTSIGLGTNDAFPRVENNFIQGLVTGNGAVTCLNAAVTAQSFAVAVANSSSSNEIDLHSNSLFGSDQLALAGCVSRALAFDVSDGGTPTAPRGLVRNNVLHAGYCPTRYDVQELSAAADPRVLQNNWFDRAVGNGVVVYRDEAATDLFDAGQVNALTDLTSSGNIEGQCVTSPAQFHLTATSVCRNAGTDAGAPRVDIDGDSRPQEAVFDIGADEYVP